MTPPKLQQGAKVDHFTPFFGWRGCYQVIAPCAIQPGRQPCRHCYQLNQPRIKNLGTGSEQHVRPETLRPARLSPFRIF